MPANGSDAYVGCACAPGRSAAWFFCLGLTVRRGSADAVDMARLRFAWAAIPVAVAGAGLLAGVPTARAAQPPEPAVGEPGREGDYLRVIHGRLHPSWAESYIRMSPYNVVGPVSSERQAEVSINIRWDGTIESLDVTKSSGSFDFDSAALNAVTLAAPFPPPVDVLADDGLAHLKWRFARNYRLCSGGEIVRVEFPLQIALPNLALRGQLGEALRRMNAEFARSGWGAGDFVTPFARQWLGRPHLNTELDARAAAALAVAGDRQKTVFLETALLQQQTAATAAMALERIGIDVGARLSKALAGGAAESARPAVVAAIRAVPAIANRCPECTPALAAAALNPRYPLTARIEMIQILGRMDRTPVIAQALAHATNDTNKAIRGAALLAQVTPGRVGVIKMVALLHDRAAEIRAAATAGVLRAGGDSGIEHLYLLARERDPRPLIAAADELGRMSSTSSAELLAKLLKRSEKNVRLAAIRALAGRRDPSATALVDPILADARVNPAAESGVRELAMAAANTDELIGISADTRLGPSSYRALLRANLRQEAARWLLGNLEQLSPEDRITALGDWIGEAPKYAAQK